MATTFNIDRLIVRHGTTAQWAASTRILEDGELGADTTKDELRMGDGVRLWADLKPFITTAALVDLVTQSAGFGPVHEQFAPSASWTINHTLNRYPAVTVLDTDGKIVIADVTYASLSQINISFGDPTAGKAVLT